MQRFIIANLAAFLLLTTASQAAIAEDYWSSSYKGFDVVTTAGSAYATALAHDLARFDTALTRILQLPERRLPTHIYELPPKEVRELLGDANAASYKFSGYEVWVITRAGPDEGRRFWGALFGYAGSLLVSGQASRSPYWYRIGVPLLFAHTQFALGTVTTGDIDPGLAVSLGKKLIPMRVFLGIQPDDPQVHNSSDFRQLFEAESWFLAREVYVEGKLRSEFNHYLGLMRQGASEADAFAESFKISYEDLDKLLVAGKREAAHEYIVKVPPEPLDNQQPRKLSAIEAKALLADLSLLMQHRADASRLASEALQADPSNELSLRVLARASLQDGNFGASLTAVDKLAALTAPSAAALTDSGDVLSRLARAVSAQASIGASSDALSGRAKDAYEKAIHLDPDDLRAWSGLAELDSALLDNEAARALVTRAQAVMEKHPDNGALARALARMCYHTGQTEAALRFREYWRDDADTQRDLNEATDFMAKPHDRGGAQPNDAVGFYTRGNAYAGKRDYDRAIQDYDQAIRLKPNVAEAFNNRGYAYENEGEYDRAIQDYNQAIHLKPDFVLALINRGNAYANAGNYDRAIQDYDHTIRLKPDYAEAFNNRGITYADKGEYDRAIQDYDRAIRLKPEYANAFSNRGSAYGDKRDYDRAIQDFDETIRLRPDDPVAFSNRGRAYGAKRDYERAIQDYDQAIRLRPDYAEAFNSRCWIRATANQALEAALADCNESLRLRPDDARILDSRGFVYFRMGRYDDAIADFDKALNRKPNSAGSLYVRGLAKRMRHDNPGGNVDIAAAKGFDPKIAETYNEYGVKP